MAYEVAHVENMLVDGVIYAVMCEFTLVNSIREPDKWVPYKIYCEDVKVHSNRVCRKVSDGRLITLNIEVDTYTAHLVEIFCNLEQRTFLTLPDFELDKKVNDFLDTLNPNNP